jgi:hypothetical protein
MANRDDWARTRNRGWRSEGDWETEDYEQDYPEPFGSRSSEERGRWGSSERYDRRRARGRGEGGWERQDEDYRGYGNRWMGERRREMGDRDWERYSQPGYGRSGEPFQEEYGSREERIQGYGAGTMRGGYGRPLGYGRVTRRGYGRISRRGSFAGRGPKGWRRSDERIQEEVNEALARDPDLDASTIEVRVKNAEVTLTGVVEDRDDKRLAEDIAEEVFGIEDIHNELKVRHGIFATITGEKADAGDEREARKNATARAQSSGRSTTRTRG